MVSKLKVPPQSGRKYLLAISNISKDWLPEYTEAQKTKLSQN
jgi:hypothetical protein